MEILVISDTHKNIDRVIHLLEGEHNFDHIIHLGDHVRDAVDIESIFGIPVTYVSGNCDYYEAGAAHEQMLTFGEHRILLTHGHMYQVKSTLHLLRKIIDEGRANIVLFGHTHRAMIEYYENGIIMNPGSISLPRDGNASFGVINIDKNGKVHVNVARIS